MLEVTGLELALPDLSAKRGFARAPLVSILRNLSFCVNQGESVGVVGQSGSGKTSLGRTLMRLNEPTSGRIVFDGVDISHLQEAELRPLRRRFQMIFQDPQSSLNPRRRIGQSIIQPLMAYGMLTNPQQGWQRSEELLERVGLEPMLSRRYPHELSGGQRQRVGIARAISLEPEFVVADEIVSGLDVSSQAQILRLLRRLQSELGLTLVFISHDLSVVRAVCDRVIVMSHGEIVESGSCAEVFSHPNHWYTRELISAIPLPDVDEKWLNDIDAQDNKVGRKSSSCEAQGQAKDPFESMRASPCRWSEVRI